ILSGAMNVLILQCCVVFFFVSVYTRTCRNNARISNFGGGFRFFSKAPGKNKKKKKMTEQREFLRKTSFRPKGFFIWFSNVYEICRKREKLQRNDNDLSSNDFKYFRRYLKILPNT
ncbi:Uncharacterized protein FWK35_00003812, partial [Aphis craccivora]